MLQDWSIKFQFLCVSSVIYVLRRWTTCFECIGHSDAGLLAFRFSLCYCVVLWDAHFLDMSIGCHCQHIEFSSQQFAMQCIEVFDLQSLWSTLSKGLMHEEHTLQLNDESKLKPNLSRKIWMSEICRRVNDEETIAPKTSTAT